MRARSSRPEAAAAATDAARRGARRQPATAAQRSPEPTNAHGHRQHRAGGRRTGQGRQAAVRPFIDIVFGNDDPAGLIIQAQRLAHGCEHRAALVELGRAREIAPRLDRRGRVVVVGAEHEHPGTLEQRLGGAEALEVLLFSDSKVIEREREFLASVRTAFGC